MYDVIKYDEDNDSNIIQNTFNMVSDDNKGFSRTSWYLSNNVKINIDYLPKVFSLSSAGQKVLYYIISSLRYNTNVITINRKDALKVIGDNNHSTVTRGLKDLIDSGLIKKYDKNDKNTFIVPMDFLVRGNVDTMMREVAQRKQQREFEERENANKKSYSELTLKLRKRNGSKN